MSEDEKFLARWSRRKRDAAEESVPAAEQDATSAKHDVEIGGSRTAPSPPDKAAEPVFDPASLPPIESIVAHSDVRAFLQPGVPAALSRAALRRAWAADPAIRNFIGLAENSWDFTAADGVAGFGPLDPAEVPQLLAQVFGTETREKVGSALDSIERATDAAAPATPAPNSATKTDSPEAGPQDKAEDQPKTAEANVGAPDLLHRSNTDSALQTVSLEPKEPATQVRRGHGGALPE